MASPLEQFVNNVRTMSASGKWLKILSFLLCFRILRCSNILCAIFYSTLKLKHQYLLGIYNMKVHNEEITLFLNNLSGNFRELCEVINKSDEVLQRNSAHLNTVLETLDIQQHSLGVLAVLVAKFSLPPVSVNFTWRFDWMFFIYPMYDIWDTWYYTKDLALI